jgi:purine-binding chemotaxis protein CheW
MMVPVAGVATTSGGQHCHLRHTTSRLNSRKLADSESHTTNMDKELQVVGFRIGRETFGLPISIVREIVRVPEITAVPNAPDYIEGVINLRGRIIPVVDLRKRFGEEVEAASKKHRIVVVEMESRRIGLLVNSASEVLKIPPSEIEAPHNVFQEGELNYITGVGKLRGRLVILLDLNKVLQRGELRSLDEAADAVAEPVGSGSRNS